MKKSLSLLSLLVAAFFLTATLAACGGGGGGGGGGGAASTPGTGTGGSSTGGGSGGGGSGGGTPGNIGGFGLTQRDTLPPLAFPPTGPGSAGPGTLSLQRVFAGLTFASPVFLTHPSDGTDRIFVVEQAGRIYV